MPAFETLLTFFGVSVLLGLTPGPDNLFVLLQSAQRGWRAGMAVVLGLCAGLVVHTAAVALGLAAVFAASAMAFTVLKYCGAAYLAYLAWQALRAPAAMAQELRRAAAICTDAKQAVISMFAEARMGQAIDTAGAQVLVNEISDSVKRHPGALISLARIKTADEYTYMHSVAVCALMVALARQTGLDEEATRMAGLAGLLHDLGKAAIPLDILNKPGKLSDAEFAVIRGHPAAGHAMLQRSGLPAPVLDACLHHHEKMDGTGYPDRLQGDQISLIARMTAICDVYDAITSDRPYKRGWDPAESLRRMADWTNDHFDARLFQAFVKSIGIYPVGSLVRLTSGRLGVVVEQAPAALTTPVVKVFFSTKSDLRIPAELVNLAAPGATEKIVAREDPGQWNFPDMNELWSGFSEQVW